MSGNGFERVLSVGAMKSELPNRAARAVCRTADLPEIPNDARYASGREKEGSRNYKGTCKECDTRHFAERRIDERKHAR
jgi:hypothetical protein